MLRTGGTATVIGMIPVGQTIELHGFEFLGEKKIQGSNMGSNRFRVDMPRYVDLYLQGRLKLDELVSAPHHARRHQRRLRRDEAGRDRPLRHPLRLTPISFLPERVGGVSATASGLVAGGRGTGRRR